MLVCVCVGVCFCMLGCVIVWLYASRRDEQISSSELYHPRRRGKSHFTEPWSNWSEAVGAADPAEEVRLSCVYVRGEGVVCV